MSLLTSVRSVRIVKIAVFDVLVTFAVARMIHNYMKWSWPLFYTLLGSIVVGIITHKALGIKTQLNKYIFN
jgi:uncharacterized integral membrane protein